MPDIFTFDISDLLANDTGEDIRVTAVGQPQHGSLTFDAQAQTIAYSAPPVGYGVGEGLDYHVVTQDTFPYTITDIYGQTSTATVRVNFVPPPPTTAPATTVQMRFFNNENGHVNTLQPPMPGNLIVAVMTRASSGFFGNDPKGNVAKDPLPGWTVLAKSQPHDRVATTVVYRYVDAAFAEEVRSSSTVYIFEDAPWSAATTLVFWEFEAAPDIADAIPAYSVEVLDQSSFSAKSFGSDLDAARIVSATTVRPHTSTITVGGGDYTVTGTETNDFWNRHFKVTDGTTPGGPTLTVSGGEQLSHVALAVRKRL